MIKTKFFGRQIILGGIAILLSLGMLNSNPAWAQTYPDKTITLLVPLQAGSAGDTVLRVVAQKMAENMKQAIVVENQAGVSGLLGAERVSRAAPDGYFIGGISDSVLNFAANLVEKANFDSVGGFEPISLVANVSWVLVANPALGAKSIADLMALARAKPGMLDYASAGMGSPHHIAMEMLTRPQRVTMKHIPYKGASQSLIDVVSGQVPVMFSATSVALPFIKQGKLIALGVPTEKRSPLLPEVPTFAEGGVAGFNFATWVAMYAPKGTPAMIVNRLNAEARKALEDPAVREKLLSLGLEPAPTTPAQLAKMTADGNAAVKKIIKDAGIKAE
jgi:tripartite-type tricarboxylate transporter receptor subunit TctC